MKPKDYALRRGAWAIPTIFLVTVVTFILTRFAGSPVAMYTSRFSTQEQIEAVREAYHLNEPIWVQYLYWLQGVLQGDLGWSATSGSTVAHALKTYTPATVELAILALVIALAISLSLGTLAGRYQDTWIDHFSRSIAVAGVSTPQFWSALILVYVFFVILGWFPLGRASPGVWDSIPHPTGMYTVDALLAASPRAFFDAIWHLTMPAIVLGYANSAVIMRHLRAEMVEKKKEEYVNAARARGLSEKVVFKRHIRRNSLIPTLTVAGLSFAFLLRGAILAEIVFNYPGLGRYIASAALSNEFAPLMGFVLVVSVVVMAVNLGVDILYVYLDPRTELGE